MVGVPQGAMRVASQIWQVVLASQTLQVFCFGPSQKGTICSSGCFKLEVSFTSFQKSTHLGTYFSKNQ
jgi:hypothetical protein